jgi:hypothetical protein
MGRVGGKRTAAHSDWLADQPAERGPQLLFSGEDVDRPRALDDIVGLRAVCPSTFAFRHSAVAEVASGTNKKQMDRREQCIEQIRVERKAIN